MTSPAVERLTQVQDKIVESVTNFQDPVVETVRKGVDLVEERIPVDREVEGSSQVKLEVESR